MMKKKKIVCARDCYDVCSLIIHLNENNSIGSVQGDPDHPLTRGMVCPRSAKDGVRLYKNRVNAPYTQDGDGFKKIGWRRSLELISRKLDNIIKQYGPEHVLFLNYAGNTGLIANAFSHRLWNAIGATQTDNALCSASGHAGLSLHYGLSYGANPLEMPSMSLIVFWGFNAAVSAPHIWHLARVTRKKGLTKIVVIDPIETQTAKKADLWIRTEPGTDVALAYGVMNQLLESGKIDDAFIQGWTRGFNELKSEIETWSLEKTVGITGVHPEKIKELASMYATEKPSMTLIGYGLQRCSNGADQVRAVSFIPALLGIHRGFFYGNGSAYDIDRARIKGKTLSQKKPKVIRQVAVADHVKNGDFKFVYVSCMNPAMTLPNQNAFREGISKKDLYLVVHETHWTQTAAYADVVLPAPTYLEKDDIIIPDSHNSVSYTPKAVDPINDSRHERWVMMEIAKRLGLEDAWLYEDPLSGIRSAMTNAFEQGSFDALLAGSRLRLKCRPKHHYQTPSGKIEFFAEKAVQNGFPPLPIQRDVSYEIDGLTYITSAVSNYTHTQFQEVFGAIPPVIHMHPKNAARLGVQNGDTILVASNIGCVELKAVISDALPQSVVWSPKESGGLGSTVQNSVTSSVPQAIGSGPRFNSTRVTISVSPERT